MRGFEDLELRVFEFIGPHLPQDAACRLRFRNYKL